MTDRSGLRLGLGWAWSAWLLLLGVALCLTGLAVYQVDQLRDSEAHARSQLHAQALAARVQQALALGIPLRHLQGVQALFAQRLRDAPDIEAVALMDRSGGTTRPLWMHRRPVQHQAADEGSPPDGPRAVVGIHHQGVAVADLVVVRRDLSLWPLMLEWMGWVVGVVLLAAGLAALGAVRGLKRGPLRRRQWLGAQAGLAVGGDYSSRLSLFVAGIRAQEFDLRPAWLVAQFRQVNEAALRLRRLTASLRQTEPDADRRAQLDAILAQAMAQDRFADEAIESTPLPGDGVASARWNAWTLKTRIPLLVLVGVLVLWLVFAVLMWQRSSQLNERYHHAQLDAQRLAWARFHGESQTRLAAKLSGLMARADWQRAWSRQSRSDLGGVIDAWLADEKAVAGAEALPGLRVDVYNGQGALWVSSSQELAPQPLVDQGRLGAVLAGEGPPATGFYMSSGRLFHVRVERAQLVQGARAEDPAMGVVALGLDAASLLPDLGRALNAEAFFLNMRGLQVAGTAPGRVAAEQLRPPLREPVVERYTGVSGRALLGIVQPVLGPDQRQVAAVLTLRDVSAEQAADQHLQAWMLAVGLLCLTVLTGLLFVYLRHALKPLERSVEVLAELSRGQLAVALDGLEAFRNDEAGQIVKGVTVLRGEMLNLQMLRDERTRSRQQQERLIRNQLKQLAGSLDERSRTEILHALGSDDGRGADAAAPHSGNELAELASILARLSGLVTDQQNRLVRLLRDLQAAMAQEALLASLQHELEIAHRMQSSILPREAPATQAVELASMMIPAKEVGGDFYDYFMLDDDHMALVIADVSGKGVPAAFFMAISRTLLKTNALFLHQPAQAIRELNNQLCAENAQMMFVTVFFGVLQLRTGELVYVNAGHNPPVLRNGSGVELLPSGQNMALAVMEDLDFVEGHLKLHPGDLLVLYTDGVTEAADREAQLFGEERLMTVVRAASASVDVFSADLLAAVREFEAGAPQADDITCVTVRFRGAV